MGTPYRALTSTSYMSPYCHPGDRRIWRAWRSYWVRWSSSTSKDKKSYLIKAAYESGAARSGPIRHNDNALPSQPPTAARKKAWAQPNKQKWTSPFEIEGPYKVKPATRSTTKYNTQTHGLSNVTNKNQAGKNKVFPHPLCILIAPWLNLSFSIALWLTAQ